MQCPDWLRVSGQPAIEGDGGDPQTYKVACWVREHGISESKCFDLMWEHYNPRCEPMWEADDLMRRVKNAYNYAKNRPGWSGWRWAQSMSAGAWILSRMPCSMGGDSGSLR